MKYYKEVQTEKGIEIIETDEPQPTPPPAGPVDLPYNLERARNYPEISEQFDMIWHMMDQDIIPGKGSEWYNAIKSVKDQYPKPA